MQQLPQNLCLAAAFDTAANIKKLLSQVDVNKPDDDLDTPLHRACSWHRMDIVELLLKHGAKPNLYNKAGITALHALIAGTDIHQEYQADALILSTIRHLFKSGATPNDMTQQGESPFCLCLRVERYQLASHFLELGCKPCFDCGRDHLEQAIHVIWRGPDRGTNGPLPKWAIEWVTRPSSIKAAGRTILHALSSSFRRRDQLAEALLNPLFTPFLNVRCEEGISHPGETPLIFACQRPALHTIQLLIIKPWRNIHPMCHPIIRKYLEDMNLLVDPYLVPDLRAIVMSYLQPPSE